MVLVAVTRLRLRSSRYLLPFLWNALFTTRQAKQSPGNLSAATRAARDLVFWTISLWQDEASMKSYRNSGAHLRAMPKLRQWCSEATTIHWQQEQAEMPTWQQAEQHLAEAGVNRLKQN